MEGMDKLFTPEQVAEYLQFAPKTIKDYLREGLIKGIKVGNEWRVKKSDLEAYVKSLDGTTKEK